MSVSELRLYDLMKNKLGVAEAESFMEFLDETVQQKVSHSNFNLATKEDLHQTKIDLIKWVFAFWITIILLIAGLYIKISVAA